MESSFSLRWNIGKKKQPRNKVNITAEGKRFRQEKYANLGQNKF